MISAAVFLSAFLLFLRTAAPGLELEDAGEVILSAFTLGVSSAPGAPWHAMVSRLFLGLTVGSPAFRITLVSVAAGALAVVAVGRIAVRLSGGGPGSVAAGLIASLALMFGRPFWWQAGIAGVAVPLAAVGAWALVAAGSRRGVWMAAALAGFSWGVDVAGLAVAGAVLPVVLRRRGSPGWRSLAFAVCCLGMPLAAHGLYLGIRGAAVTEVGRGWTDRAPELVRHYAGLSAGRNGFLRDRSVRAMAGEALRHGAALPWLGFGPLLAVALAGAWAVRRRDPDTAGPVIALLAWSVGVGVIFQRPEGERWAALAAVPVAAFTGAGAAWLGGLRSWAPLACAAAIAWQGATAFPMSRRDRSTHATDHVRNLLAFVRPGDRVWAGGDLAGRVLLFARVVDLDPRAAGVRSSDALAWGTRERQAGGESDPALRGSASGPALLWAMARAPVRVFLTADQPPGLLPSRGFRWRGLLVRVTDPVQPAGRDEPDARWVRGLRLGSFFRARGAYPSALMQGCSLALYARARLVADPAAMEAEARVALWLNGAQPEPRLTLGRALLARRREPEAVEEWQRALALTGGAYLDPYLELSALAERRARDRTGGARSEALEESLEFLRTAAALGAGADSADIAAGDAARAGGRTDTARTWYGRAVATGFDARGLNHFVAGRYPQAAVAWEEAVARDPGSGSARHHLGTLAAIEERFGDAQRWYHSALRLPGASADLSELAARAGESMTWAPRMAALERRAAAAPGDPDALVDLGNACFYLGRTGAALDLYRRALRQDAGSVRALANLGSALVQSGRVDEAIASYERVYALDPRHADACVNLVAVYLGMGQRDRARLWLDRALAIRPDHPRARQLAPAVGP